ncbi:MAG: O-antigen ligase family protein [Sulfuricurvum sp.]
MKISDRTFYYSALLFAFTLPLSRAAVSFFILWFVVLFLVRKDFKTSWEMIKSNRALVAMGAFISIMFISLLWSNDTHEALNQIRLYSYWILIPILATTLKKEWLLTIITAFLTGMFVSEIVAYGIFFEWWSYKNSTPDYPSPFMFHIHYSIFLATTSILLLSRLLSYRYTWQSKLPMFLFFLTSTGNLMLSTGRTGQLALLVAIGVAVIIHYRLTIKSFFIFVTLGTMLFVGAYTTLDLFQKRFDMAVSDVRQFQKGNFDTSWGLRAAFWVVTYDIIREHPLIGIGIGDYKSAAAQTLAKNNHNFTPETIKWCSNNHYHNQYLMILAQIGIIGFALMLWMLIELFRLKIEDQELREFSKLGLTVFVVACIAEPLWILQFPIILFVFVTSISLVAARGAKLSF